MSMDYPVYEELGSKHRGMARLWMLGDRLYYIGLLGMILDIPAGIMYPIFTRMAGHQIGLTPLASVIAFLILLAIFVTGGCLKGYAVKRGGLK